METKREEKFPFPLLTFNASHPHIPTREQVIGMRRPSMCLYDNTHPSKNTIGNIHKIKLFFCAYRRKLFITN